MIALGKGVCSEETVDLGHPYLARIGERYFVIKFLDGQTGAFVLGSNKEARNKIPFSEAVYFDPLSNPWWEVHRTDELHEFHPIY